MKKLSILIALILCVTIGGVYATWLYPGNQLTTYDVRVTQVMAPAELEGSYGSYNTVSNSLGITIDQESATSFKAVLGYTGELVIAFNPHANISDAQTEAALNASLSVTGTDLDTAVYGGKEIWAVDEDAKFEFDPTKWVETGDGKYTYTITWADLKGMITLANDFVLPTIDEYEDFRDAQRHAIFIFHISADTVNYTPAA